MNLDWHCIRGTAGGFLVLGIFAFGSLRLAWLTLTVLIR